MNPSIYCSTILGSNMLIAKFGTMSGSNKISELVAPTPPTAETPGPWIKLGKVKSAKPNYEYKTIDVEGVNDDGIYETEELRLATKRKIQIVTGTVTKEALQLTFGLKDEIVDGTEQQPFASSADEILCWAYHRLRDSYHEGTELANLMYAVKLRLTSPLNMSSDAASPEWEVSIVHSPLNAFNSQGINPKA